MDRYIGLIKQQHNAEGGCRILKNEILPSGRCQRLWVLRTPVSRNEDQPARRANQYWIMSCYFCQPLYTALIYTSRGVSVTGFASAKGWKINLSWEQKVYFCCDLWQVKCRHQLNEKNPTERVVDAACLIMLRDWGFQLNALNVCKYMQHGFFFHFFCVCEHPIH